MNLVELATRILGNAPRPDDESRPVLRAPRRRSGWEERLLRHLPFRPARRHGPAAPVAPADLPPERLRLRTDMAWERLQERILARDPALPTCMEAKASGSTGLVYCARALKQGRRLLMRQGRCPGCLASGQPDARTSVSALFK